MSISQSRHAPASQCNVELHTWRRDTSSSSFAAYESLNEVGTSRGGLYALRILWNVRSNMRGVVWLMWCVSPTAWYRHNDTSEKYDSGEWEVMFPILSLYTNVLLPKISKTTLKPGFTPRPLETSRDCVSLHCLSLLWGLPFPRRWPLQTYAGSEHITLKAIYILGRFQSFFENVDGSLFTSRREPMVLH